MVGRKDGKRPIVVNLSDGKTASGEVASYQGRRRAIGGSPSATASPSSVEGRGQLYSFSTGKKIIPPDTNPKNSFASLGACLDLLGNSVSRVGPTLEKMLRIPNEVFILDPTTPIISSEPNKNCASVAFWLVYGTSKPMDFASFSITISSKGESMFCTLVDKSRKIVVNACVRTFQGGSGWEGFENSIRKAWATAHKLKQEGREFDFVLAKEGRVQVY